MGDGLRHLYRAAPLTQRGLQRIGDGLRVIAQQRRRKGGRALPAPALPPRFLPLRDRLRQLGEGSLQNRH